MAATPNLRNQLDKCKRILLEIANSDNSGQNGYSNAPIGINANYIPPHQSKGYLVEQAKNSIISTTQSLQAELAGLAATLQRWKEANKRAKCGIPVPRDATEINSPTLQVKFDAIFEIALELIVKISSVINHLTSEHQQTFQQLQNNLFLCMTEALRSSFVVEKQPPMVISKLKPIEVQLKLLMSKLSQHCDLEMGKNAVSVVLLKEDEISQTNFSIKLNESRTAEFTICSNNSNNVGTPTTLEQTENGLLYYIADISFDQKKRRVQNHATEQQYVLAFQISLTVKRLPHHKIWVHTLSLPFSIIVQSTIQEFSAQMNVAYDYTLSNVNASGMLQKVSQATVEDTVSMLNHFFNKVAGTSREFSALNKAALASKLLKTYVPWNAYENVKHEVVQRTQLLHGTVNGDNLAFAKWFWLSAKVIKNAKLTRCYDEWLIEGFVNKSDAEQLLKSLETSCIIARFSDSLPGKVVFSVCYYKIDLRQNIVDNLMPYDAAELKTKETYDILENKLFRVAQHFYISKPNANPNRLSYGEFLKLLPEEARVPSVRRPQNGYIQAEMIESNNVCPVEATIGINQAMHHNQVVTPQVVFNIEQHHQQQPALGSYHQSQMNQFAENNSPGGYYESMDVSPDSYAVNNYEPYQPLQPNGFGETMPIYFQGPSTSRSTFSSFTAAGYPNTLHSAHEGTTHATYPKASELEYPNSVDDQSSDADSYNESPVANSRNEYYQNNFVPHALKM